MATIVFTVTDVGISTLDWLNIGQTDGTLLLDSALNTIKLRETSLPPSLPHPPYLHLRRYG